MINLVVTTAEKLKKFQSGESIDVFHVLANDDENLEIIDGCTVNVYLKTVNGDPHKGKIEKVRRIVQSSGVDDKRNLSLTIRRI